MLEFVDSVLISDHKCFSVQPCDRLANCRILKLIFHNKSSKTYQKAMYFVDCIFMFHLFACLYVIAMGYSWSVLFLMVSSL